MLVKRFFVPPLFSAPPPPSAFHRSQIVKEEVFGPVMSLLTFSTEEEAVSRANASPYGLGAGIMTNDLSRAHRVAKRFQSGNVWINNYNLAPSEMPFGGYGMSGFGRENGVYAIENYTQIKNVYVEMGGEFRAKGENNKFKSIWKARRRARPGNTSSFECLPRQTCSSPEPRCRQLMLPVGDVV